MDVRSVAVDPEFVDAAGLPGSFALEPTSPALALGFKRLPAMDAPTLGRL